MFQSKGDYDRGVNTFSPEGRLFQVEYALEAVKLGSTVVGITTREGVVIAAEKRLPSSLVVPNSIEKILFSPEASNYKVSNTFKVMRNWKNLCQIISQE